LSGSLLDTDILINLVFARSATLNKRFAAAALSREPLFLSAISLYEFRFGAERSKHRSFQLAALDRFLERASVANFDSDDAGRAALLKGALAAQGRLIGPYDLLIAGQALARGWTVVTGNTDEFSRVEGLEVEDWTLSA
jgi:tRNA(fMet)-specific endonuclease VapC